MKNHDIIDIEVIDIYKNVLSGKLKKFPNGFWNFTVSKEDEKRNAAKITRYLIEDILKWTTDNVKISFDAKIIRKYKLGGMAAVLFSGKIYEIVNNAYPDKIKPWEMHKAPQGYWNLETSKVATKWLIEEKLKWSIEDIKNNLTKSTFIENGLFAAMDLEGLDVSPYKTIVNAYGKIFNPWEMKMCPMGFWNEETAGIAVRWLIEEKLKLTESQIVNITEKTFIEYGIYGAYNFCGESIVRTLNMGYPNTYRKIGNVIYTFDGKHRRTLVSKNNTSKVSGVYFSKKRKRWTSSMSIDGIQHFNGSYMDYIDAVKSRLLAEKNRLKK